MFSINVDSKNVIKLKEYLKTTDITAGGLTKAYIKKHNYDIPFDAAYVQTTLPFLGNTNFYFLCLAMEKGFEEGLSTQVFAFVVYKKKSNCYVLDFIFETDGNGADIEVPTDEIILNNGDWSDYLNHDFRQITDDQVLFKRINLIIPIIFLIFCEALNNYKRVIKCKKYENRIHDYGEELPTRDIDLCNGIRIVVSKKTNDDDVRNYVRRTECWGVRGHYRHYKNGKTIFINSYSKGKGKTKQTNYVIGGKKE